MALFWCRHGALRVPGVQNGGDQPGHHAAQHRSTLKTRRKHQAIARFLGDTWAVDTLIPSVLDTPGPTTPDNHPHRHAGPPKTTAPSRTAHEQASGYCMLVLTDAADPPRSRSSTETTVQPAVDWVARASALDPPRAKVRPGRRTDLDAEPDRSRRGFRPISMRITTDLGDLADLGRREDGRSHAIRSAHAQQVQAIGQHLADGVVEP